MPTIKIRNKICSHCGGNRWYINPKTEQSICYEKLMESNRRYQSTKRGKIALERARKKERDNITDNYLRQLIYLSIYNETGETIDRQAISKSHLEKYRENIKFKRTHKLTNHGNKELKHEKAQRNRRSIV